jgi:hypothetical protein
MLNMIYLRPFSCNSSWLIEEIDVPLRHCSTNKQDGMNKLFIGREKEQQQLKEYINSEQSEFIAVYGRRRVGKTFLIQKVIGCDYAFYVAGMNKVSMRIQLKNFMQGIRRNCPEVPLAKTWLDAFMIPSVNKADCRVLYGTWWCAFLSVKNEQGRRNSPKH